jgi:hypothetical protein
MTAENVGGPVATKREWIPMSRLESLKFADDHTMLASKLVAFMARTRMTEGSDG